MYLKNPKLETIKKDFKGNLFKNGKFQNLYGKSGSKSFVEIMKWILHLSPQEKIKITKKYSSIKVIRADDILNEKRDHIYWLGHATFLLQIDGKKILTDPCLTSLPFTRRLTKLPIKIKKIQPDYLLISHAHRDHLDYRTIKHFDNCTALVPLNMTKLIKKMNPNIISQEAGWYQKYDLSENFEIFFMPAHHWSKRNLFDTNKILWGSFIIKTKTKTIYFAGDSGYSNHFKDIGEIFDPIDIAILPIGAYNPAFIMKDSHISPSEALKVATELNAKKIIPMHFGTFKLSDEPIGEPEQLLRELDKDKKAHFLNIGEKLLLG